MPLSNSKLDSIYTELCGLLTEIGDEQVRTRFVKDADPGNDLERLAVCRCLRGRCRSSDNH